MPSIKDQNTIDLIADNYCTNGQVKGKALRSAGYSKHYSEHGGLKLFDNIRVKQAIDRRMADLAVVCQHTIEDSQRKLDRAYDLAEKLNQPSAMVSSTREMDVIHGLIKENIQIDTLEQAELTAAERREARILAKLRLSNLRLYRTGEKGPEPAEDRRTA